MTTQTTTQAPDGRLSGARSTAGVLLTMCSGLAVVGIGLVMCQVLEDANRRLALW